jgi:hypothetical protein
MLNFFKSNNLAVIFVNVILIVLYRLLYCLHPIDLAYIYHHAEPASHFFIRLLHIGPHTSAIALLAAGGILCFIESMLVNRIINSHKVATKKNYLGGVLFVVFTSMIPECLVISPALVATFFLLLCIGNIFDLSRPEKLYGSIFDLGFLSAAAMLFYFPSVYFIFFVAIGFYMMRSVSLRESMMILSGFLAVLLVVFTVYFWYDSLPEMALDLVNAPYRIPMPSIRFSHEQVIVLCWILLLALWVLAHVPALLFSTVIQTRKYITILVINGLLCLLVFPLLFNFNLSHLVFLFTSLSILYAVYFVETKTSLITDLLFIVLILSVFILEYLPLLVNI